MFAGCDYMIGGIGVPTHQNQYSYSDYVNVVTWLSMRPSKEPAFLQRDAATDSCLAEVTYQGSLWRQDQRSGARR